MCIEAPVGFDAVNRPNDVKLIQLLLNLWLGATGNEPLQVDGTVSARLLNRLEQFLIQHHLVSRPRRSPLEALLNGGGMAAYAPVTQSLAVSLPELNYTPRPSVDTNAMTETMCLNERSPALRALLAYVPVVDQPADLQLEHLQIIMIESPEKTLADWLPTLREVFAAVEFSINTRPRMAHFLAQCAVETARLQATSERGGEAYLAKYEPDQQAGKNVGNTETGDGALFKGRGLLHLTGRENYTKFQKYKKAAGQPVDLTSDATKAEQLATNKKLAAESAAWFWSIYRKVNPIADTGKAREVTRAVNGGLNGLEDRERCFNRARYAIMRQ